jgi:hypothetical protein
MGGLMVEKMAMEEISTFWPWRWRGSSVWSVEYGGVRGERCRWHFYIEKTPSKSKSSSNGAFSGLFCCSDIYPSRRLPVSRRYQLSRLRSSPIIPRVGPDCSCTNGSSRRARHSGEYHRRTELKRKGASSSLKPHQCTGCTRCPSAS